LENNVLQKAATGRIKKIVDPSLLLHLSSTKSATLLLGVSRFFTVAPCDNGHVVERRTDNGICVQCDRDRNTERRNKDGKPQRIMFKDLTLTEQKEHTKRVSKYHYERNKDKVNARTRKFIENNPEAVRGYRLKRVYGLSLEEYDTLVFRQGGVCAICSKPPSDKKNHSMLYVDHDHTTGVVRGLLCRDCNLALGLFEDSKSFLKAAISYLSI